MKTSRAELKRRARKALVGNYGTMILAAIIFGMISGAVTTASQIGTMGGGAVGQALSRLPAGDFPATADSGVMFSMNFPAYMYAIFGVLGLIYSWIAIFFVVGMIRMSLNVVREGKAEISQLFWAFKNGPVRLILLQLLVYVLEFVSAVPVIVLGIALAVSAARASVRPDYGQILFLILFLLGYLALMTVIYILVGLNFGLVYYCMADHPEMGTLQSLRETYEMMRGNRLRYLVLQLSFIGWSFLSALTLGIGNLWIAPYIRCTFAEFYLDLQPRTETLPPQWAGWEQPPLEATTQVRQEEPFPLP